MVICDSFKTLVEIYVVFPFIDSFKLISGCYLESSNYVILGYMLYFL